METMTIDRDEAHVAGEQNVRGELGKITILEAMATEPVSTDAISFDGVLALLLRISIIF